MAASKNFSLKQFFLLITFSDFKQLPSEYTRFAQDFTYLAYSKANDASNMAENWYVRYMRTNVRKKDGCCWKNFCIRERDIIRSN